MDYILKQGVAFQIRSELSSDPRISASFSDHAELEEYIKSKITEREKILGLDKPWYSPQRIGYAMYNIITLDFGQAVFLTHHTIYIVSSSIIVKDDLLLCIY